MNIQDPHAESRSQLGMTSFSELDDMSDKDGDFSQDPENIRNAPIFEERKLKSESINQFNSHSRMKAVRNKPKEKYFKGSSAAKEEIKGIQINS